ncbi:MAG: pyruvate kinase, partial [Clostridia bacterium]|nr:pyruvate kinase [Clostridia bacterium]
MRKTKIVCTLGPATDNYATLKKLVRAGMSVARLNMSHGSYEEHTKRMDMVKQVRKELGLPVAILLDTRGPEIRIKTFENGVVELIEGEKFTLTTEEIVGTEKIVSVTYLDMPKHLKKGDTVLLNDGMIELVVDGVTENEVHCTVVNGGELTNRKSINLPGIEIDMPYLSDSDRADIEFAV